MCGCPIDGGGAAAQTASARPSTARATYAHSRIFILLLLDADSCPHAGDLLAQSLWLHRARRTGGFPCYREVTRSSAKSILSDGEPWTPGRLARWSGDKDAPRRARRRR